MKIGLLTFAVAKTVRVSIFEMRIGWGKNVHASILPRMEESFSAIHELLISDNLSPTLTASCSDPVNK
jgi:hypothetical protein